MFNVPNMRLPSNNGTHISELMYGDAIKTSGSCLMSLINAGCPVRTRWGCLQAILVRELESTTLEQLALEANELVTLPAVQEVEKALVASAD